MSSPAINGVPPALPHAAHAFLVRDESAAATAGSAIPDVGEAVRKTPLVDS